MSKQIQFDRFDTILSLAAAEYMRQETEAFLSAETDAALSEETERKINRMIRIEKGKKTRRKVWKVLRTVLIAALAAATVALAACVAHPEIREAIWKVVLTWGDESVKIDFVPANPNRKPGANSADTNNPTQKPNAPIPDAPKSIEAVRIPGYMPNGWTSKGSASDTVFRLNYYNANSDFKASYRQMLIGSDNIVDSEGATVTHLSINGWDGVFLTYQDDPDAYVLYWQDYEYRYGITGYFDSLDQLIRMAESVYVEAGGVVDEASKSIKTIYAPSYMPEGYTTESNLLNNCFRLSYYNADEERVITYRQSTIDANSTVDAEGATATELTVNGWDGILLTYEDEPNVYTLYWQDYEYRYNIYGDFETVDELILMAESVYATSSHPTPPAQPEQPTEPANPPKSIEKVMIPGYMPAGYTYVDYKTRKSYMLEYYDTNGESIITYMQVLISFDFEADADQGKATHLTINGFDAVIITYADEPNVYNLYWQDYQYQYNIHGKFDSLAQLLRMAESVYDEPGAHVDEPPKSIETIYAPSYIPTEWMTEGTRLRTKYMILYYNQEGKGVVTFNQMTTNTIVQGDAEEANATEITLNGWTAVLLTYEDEPNKYNLYWQDYEYRYSITGYFENYDELIRLAESVYK